MPKATIPGGGLINLSDCYVFIPTFGRLRINNLPDISDKKSASYSDETIIGRSFPMKTYSHSENRSISVSFHFFVVEQSDIDENIRKLRAIMSCLYPREGSGGGAPYTPPPVCRIKCGQLLADDEVCVILRDASVKFPTDVAWDENTYVPYKFDVDTSWEVVYTSTDLPGQSRILQSGR